jgi:hypothetical protein
MSMSGNHGLAGRLNPFWQPWLVPRVERNADHVVASAPGKRVSLLERLVKRRELTPMQRVLAIHIINATHPTDPNLA